jgi:hypothetical protein
MLMLWIFLCQLQNDSISNGSLALTKVAVPMLEVQQLMPPGIPYFLPGFQLCWRLLDSIYSLRYFRKLWRRKGPCFVRDPNVQDNIIFQKYLLNQEQASLNTV